MQKTTNLQPINKQGAIVFSMLCLVWWIFGIIAIKLIPTVYLFRFFNAWENPFLDILMPAITTFGEGWMMIIVIALVMIIKKRFRNFRFAIVAIVCLPIPSLLTNILKRLLDFPRPLSFWHDAGWINQVAGYQPLYSNAHPSGHTTAAFSMFCFLSIFLSKKWSNVAILYFALALLTGFSRIYLAQHFFDDVWAGSIMGTTVTFIIFKIFYKKQLV